MSLSPAEQLAHSTVKIECDLAVGVALYVSLRQEAILERALTDKSAYLDILKGLTV